MKKFELIRKEYENLQAVEMPEGLTPIQARYAHYTLQGYGPQDAYTKALGSNRKYTPYQISRLANKAKNNALVQQYLKALVAELERVAVANALDIQMYLTAAMFTPIGAIDEHHPLCQEKVVVEHTDKDGATTTRTTLKMVSKTEAYKALIRMKGLDAPIKVDHMHRGGVMIVPMAQNVDDWENAAAQSQKLLMADAVEID